MTRFDVDLISSSEASATPCARSRSRTRGLCTSSPKMVSGASVASCSASEMASRTPKHIPKCSASRIFILDPGFLTLCYKVIGKIFSFLPRPHDLVEHIQIIFECPVGLGRQRITGLRPDAHLFGNGDKAQFV